MGGRHCLTRRSPCRAGSADTHKLDAGLASNICSNDVEHICSSSGPCCPEGSDLMPLASAAGYSHSLVSAASHQSMHADVQSDSSESYMHDFEFNEYELNKHEFNADPYN